METAHMIGVWVDLNSRKGGYVPAYQTDAEGELEVGASVYAWDENEPGLRAPGVVVSFHQDTGEALLEVDWDHVDQHDDTASNTGTPGRRDPTRWIWIVGPQIRPPRLHESRASAREFA